MPKQPKHKRLSDTLNQNAAIRNSRLLSTLMARASFSDNIADRLEECLPTQLKGHFHVAGLENQCLTLLCSSAALATRFRFEQDKILVALQMRIGESAINSIKIQIRPNLINEQKDRAKRARTRQETKNAPVEKRLGEILERLESRSKG